MRVTSPVGQFPFQAKRVTVKQGRMVVEGWTGAWPATVDLEPRDLFMLARLVPWQVFAVGGVALAGMLRWQRHRNK